MEERRNVKQNKSKYIELTKEIKKMCHKAEQDYHGSLWKEIEELNRKHNSEHTIW